jgi:uncharacterized protein
MKRLAKFVPLTLVLLVAVVGLQTGCTAAGALTQAAATSTTERTVHVSGTGQVEAVPDVANLTLGVQTQNQDANTAMQQNNQQMQALITTLTDNGVPQDNIQTQTLQLVPQYQQSTQTNANAEPTIVGYRAINTVNVRVTDLSTLGDLLTAAVSAGGNTIQQISFEVSDPSTYLTQARQAAWTDAQQKASQLAQLGNATLGQVLTITETTRSPSPVVRESLAQAASPVPIQAGTQTIEVDIDVTWQLQ